jgi:hypothetical protein
MGEESGESERICGAVTRRGKKRIRNQDRRTSVAENGTRVPREAKRVRGTGILGMRGNRCVCGGPHQRNWNLSLGKRKKVVTRMSLRILNNTFYANSSSSIHVDTVISA